MEEGMEDSSRQFSSRRRTFRRGQRETSEDSPEIWTGDRKPHQTLQDSALGGRGLDGGPRYLVLVEVDLDGLQLRHLSRNGPDLVLRQVQQVQVPQGSQSGGETRELVPGQAECPQGSELAQRGRQLLDPVPVQTQSLQLLQLPDVLGEDG